MLPNDDLARWGEPPTDPRELALAELFAELGTWNLRGPANATTRLPAEREAEHLLETSAWMNQLVHTVLERAGLFDNAPPPAAPGEPSPSRARVDLRLTVSRLLPTGTYQCIAATHPIAAVLRDLRRIPDFPDRVTLRNGDRVRVEAVCDRPGFLTVLNVGPTGNVNLLSPAPGEQPSAVRANESSRLLEVEVIPPVGRERLYAIWTRQSATVEQLASLVRPGTALRDMVRVQERLSQLPSGDWHAVLLELDHQS